MKLMNPKHPVATRPAPRRRWLSCVKAKPTSGPRNPPTNPSPETP